MMIRTGLRESVLAAASASAAVTAASAVGTVVEVPAAMATAAGDSVAGEPASRFTIVNDSSVDLEITKISTYPRDAHFDGPAAGEVIKAGEQATWFTKHNPPMFGDFEGNSYDVYVKTRGGQPGTDAPDARAGFYRNWFDARYTECFLWNHSNMVVLSCDPTSGSGLTRGHVVTFRN